MEPQLQYIQTTDWKSSGLYAWLSPIFSKLHNITNEDASAINPVTTENTEDSHLQMGTHALCYHYHELTPWTKEMRHNGV